MASVWVITKNCLIWFLLVVFLSLPIILLAVVKAFVILLAKIVRPSLTPFKARDVMTIGDSIYTKPLINIGFILKVDGNISVEEVRSHFYKTLLEPVDSRTGRRLNQNLSSSFQRFWGYGFKQGVKLKEGDLQDLIYKSSLENGETLSDFVYRFFYCPYGEEKPLWSVALLQSVDPCDLDESFGGTTLLFRIHHCLADGYSLIYLFEQLAGGTLTKMVVPAIRETAWDKIRLLFAAPTTMMEFGKKISSVPNAFPCGSSSTKVKYALFTLELETIKMIRSKTGAHVTSILLTLLGSVLRRILLEENGNDDAKLPEYICTANSLPWPDHPKDRMCNEWTVGIFKISIKNPNALERLRETERDFVDFHEAGVHKIVKRVMLPVMSLLPVTLLEKSAKAETPVTTSWATIVAGNNYKLMGNKISSIWPFVGFTSERMAVVSISLSHSQKIDVTMGINEEFVSDSSTFTRIKNYYFHDELHQLVTLLEA